MAKGEFDLASKEFLNNDEYRESLRDKTGIAPRMMKLSKALAQEHAVRGQKKGGEDKNISFPEAVERALNP